MRDVHHFESTPTERIAKLSLFGIALFAGFDQVRSIGQNVEAEGIGDNLRTIVTADFNPWEQAKDYFLPQDALNEPSVTKNQDKAPMFDPERDIDLGHILLGGALFALKVYAK